MARELTDEEVFGTPTTGRIPAGQELTDEDVFGTPKARPQEPESPSLYDYGKEVGKQVATGLVGGSVVSPLHGFGAAFQEVPVDPIAAYSRAKEIFEERNRAEPGGPFQQRITMADATRQAIEETRTRMPRPRPATESPVYQAGTAVEKATERALAPRDILHPVVRDVARGVGSFGGNVLSAMINPWVGIATMTGQGMGEAAERAVAAKVSPERQVAAAGLGAFAGATEFVDALIPMLGGTGKVLGLVNRVGLRALQGAAAEGGQEGVQQLIQNAIEKGIYNPERDYFHDVPYNMLIGAIVGGGASAVLGGRASDEPVAPEADTVIEDLLRSQGISPDSPPGVNPEAALTTPLPEPPVVDETEGRGGVRGAPGAPPTAGPVEAPAEQPVPPAAPTEAPPAPAPPTVAPPEQRRAPKDIDEAMLQALHTDLSHIEWKPGQVQSRTGLSPSDISFLRHQGFDVGLDGVIRRDVWNRIQAKVLPEVALNEMDPEVVQFLKGRAPPLDTGRGRDPQTDHPTMSALRSEMRAKTGFDPKILDVLGQTIYGSPKATTEVSVKELTQNAFDAIKGMLDRGEMTEGNIDIDLDLGNRTVTVRDDGTGMTPEILSTKFLEVGGSVKETDRPSGSLGIAKLQTLFSNQSMKVTTMRNGVVSEMVTDGPSLKRSFVDPDAAPVIKTRKPSQRDFEMFPAGHGTVVTVKIPESFRNTTTGETEAIDFPTYTSQHSNKTLRYSPLFRNINVRLNGNALPLGKEFPSNEFMPLFTVKSAWGRTKVYVAKAAKVITPETSYNEREDYYQNVSVLSNGLWQFNTKITPAGASSYDEGIKRRFYFDLEPHVKPAEGGYPFDLNRQQFTPSASTEFGKIMKYIQLMFDESDYRSDLDSFGEVEYLVVDPDGRVERTQKMKLEPKVPPKDTALAALKPGDSIEITKKGDLKVRGKKVPDLTPEQVSSYKIDYGSLTIDQNTLNPSQVMVHDNVDIKISDFETRSVVNLGRERFGEAFDAYLYDLGSAFQDLRNVVAETMQKAEPEPVRGKGIRLDYGGLKKEVIGVGFDVEWRGISILVPFRGMFINPAAPEYNDPVRASVGMTYTMIHELAHYQIRSHDAMFPAEMQRILNNLDAHPSFNLHDFKQRMVTIVSSNQEIADFLSGVFHGDLGTISPRFKRLQDSGTNEARVRGLTRRGAEPVALGAGGPPVAEGPVAGEGTALFERRRPNVSLSPSGTGRTDNGLSANAAALRSEPNSDPGVPPVPQQPDIAGPRKVAQAVFSGNPPPPVKAAAGHADRMNKWYAWTAGLDQLLMTNKNFLPLRLYKSLVQRMHVEETQLQDVAVAIAKRWRHAGAEGERLTEVMDALNRMTYLSQQEVTQGIVRPPTPAEKAALFRKHKITGVGTKLLDDIDLSLRGFQTLIGQAAKDRIDRTPGITNKTQLKQAVDREIAELQKRPYYPFMRFGDNFVYMKDPGGNLVQFDTFEKVRQQKGRYEELKKEFVKRYGRAPTKDEVSMGVLPISTGPLVGLPPLLLKEMEWTMKLTPAQINTAHMLTLAYSQGLTPVLSPTAQRRYYVPGYSMTNLPKYSMDVKRGFGKYFFHGSRFYTRSKYSQQLEQTVEWAERAPGNKETKVGRYMRDHMDNTVLDARGDFGIFKGAIFTWTMGYVPAAATMNLSQVPMISFPWLAAKFGGVVKGDTVAAKALVGAMANKATFYRRGSYHGQTDFELRAFGYGIETGRISETQAPELAGIAQGAGLLKGIGGNQFERGATLFLEKAATMFEMAEQFNRRVTYLAALRLAQKYPNAKAVKEAMDLHANEYQDLITGSSQRPAYSSAEAQAIVTANHAVDQTQYTYSRWARPRFMRGPLPSTLFVFKKYMQSTLYMLAQNPTDVLPRYLLIAAFIGGMMGLPGMEDIQAILRLIGKGWFGKDFSLEKEARRYALQYTDKPDMILHGLARRGMGIPALLDMLGSFATGIPGRGFEAPRHVKNEKTGEVQPRGFGTNVPFPVFDRSRAFTMGPLLGVNIDKLLAPGVDQDRVVAEQIQKASGAVFSVGFNFYKFLFDSQNSFSDPKRWERALPRGLANASRAFRAYDEGRERTKGGPGGGTTVIPYDVRDTEQMMEIIGVASGYQPLRLQARWDSVMAGIEHEKYLEFQKKGLYNQLYEARSGGRKEEIQDVVENMKKFNRGLDRADRGMAITDESIERSLQGRERGRILRERGEGTRPSNVPLRREINELYPEATIDVRRVR